MIMLIFLGLNRLIRDMPRIAATTTILHVAIPARDVGFVNERHSDGEAVDRQCASLGQVKDKNISLSMGRK